MAPRRRGFKKIDFTHWTGFQASSLGQASGSVAIQLIAAEHESATLLRTRGSVVCYLDGVQAPPTLVQVAIGMFIVPEASAAVVTAAPGTNPDSPWFWYDIFTIGYEEYVTDVIDGVGLSVYRREIDSKAMRIIRNQEIQLVIQNTTLEGASAINTVVNGRFLTGT